MFRIVIHIIKMFNWKAFRLKSGQCPLCGKTMFVKLNDNKWAIRCLRCGAAPNSMSLATILNQNVNDWSSAKIYVMSAGGPFFRYLFRKSDSLRYSLFFEDVPRGEYKGRVQCQDVQCLTFADNSFDICTSAEVFEHVPDDKKGFSEILRVLKPGGFHAFTVPLTLTCKTVERAEIKNGGIKHLLPPEYHNNSIRRGCVLCYRDYGYDIVSRLLSAGFAEVKIVTPDDVTGMGFNCPVIIGFKSR